MNNFLVKISLYLDIVIKGRELTKIKIIPGTFKILTQCLPGIQNNFFSIITIFYLKYLWKWVDLYCINLKRKKCLVFIHLQNCLLKKHFSIVDTALCLYILGFMNLLFFFDRKFTLWQTNFLMKKLFSVTEVGFYDRKLEERCFCKENLFLWNKLFLWEKLISVFKELALRPILSWSRDVSLYIYIYIYLSVHLSTFYVNFFEASHWPSGHMIRSRPLIGLHPPSPKLYLSYYLQRSRDSFSPVCGIFVLQQIISLTKKIFLGFYTCF